MDISALQKDVDSSENGIWFPFGEDAKVRIAQWMNKKHAAFLRDVGKKYGRRIQTKAMSEDEAKAIMAKQWEFVLTGLEGFTEGGDPVDWSAELITDWALNPLYQDFFREVEELSKDNENYRLENVQELGKLLEDTQAGISDGEQKSKSSKK